MRKRPVDPTTMDLISKAPTSNHCTSSLWFSPREPTRQAAAARSDSRGDDGQAPSCSSCGSPGSGLAPLWRIWRGCAATRDGVEAPHGPNSGGVACSPLTALACLLGVRQQWLGGSRRPHRGLEHRGAAPPSTAQATSGSLVGLWRRSDDDASVGSTATSGGGAYGQCGSKRWRPRLGDGC